MLAQEYGRHGSILAARLFQGALVKAGFSQRIAASCMRRGCRLLKESPGLHF